MSRLPVTLLLTALMPLLILVQGCSSPSDSREEAKPARISAAGYESAVAFGDNRYLAFQDFSAEGTPTVIVRDLKTNSNRVAKGYVVLRAEPAAAVLWLEPATREDVVSAIGNRQRYDGSHFLGGPFAHGFPHDAPPAKLAIWNLAEANSVPSPTAPSRWQRWMGRDDSAYLEVDVLKGSAPSAVLFSPNGRRSDGVKTTFPETVETVWPVGWSPDGTMFAVESLSHQSNPARRKRRTARDLPERQVFVIDPSDASIVASSIIDSSTARPAVWTADGGLLWVSMERSADDTGHVAIRRFDPSSGRRTEIRPPAEWKGKKPLLIGGDTNGLVFAVPTGGAKGDEVWTLDGKDFRRLGSVREFAYAYASPYGIAALTYSPANWGDGFPGWRVVPLDYLDVLPVWSGDARPVSK